MSTEAIYIDANILIYAMETDGNDGMLARRWLMQVDRGRVRAVTSELSIVEVLPEPLARENESLASGYRRLLSASSALRTVPIDRAVLLRAASLRAELRSETPDAIHVATALERACSGFLTNDARLKLPDALPRLHLRDVMDLYQP